MDTEIELFNAMNDVRSHISFEFNERTRSGFFNVRPDLNGDKIRVIGYFTTLRLRHPIESEIVSPNFESYYLKQLPSITMEIQLPEGYPGTPSDPLPPGIWITSFWLPQSIIDKLVCQVERICNASPGEPVLYHLVHFLKDESLSYIIPTIYQDYSGFTLDLREFYKLYRQELPVGIASLTNFLLTNDDDFTDLELELTRIYCSVCTETKYGTNCFCFPVCQHTFCRECVEKFFLVSLEIKSELPKFTCPECGLEVGRKEVQTVLSPEDFDAYDSRICQHSIEMMSDVVTCSRPECGAVSVIDRKEHGWCSECDRPYCPPCLTRFHSEISCPSRLEEEEKKRRREEEALSTNFIEKCKHCPNCGVPVEVRHP